MISEPDQWLSKGVEWFQIQINGSQRELIDFKDRSIVVKGKLWL